MTGLWQCLENAKLSILRGGFVLFVCFLVLFFVCHRESHMLTLGLSQHIHMSNEGTLVLGVGASCSVYGKSKGSVSHRSRSAHESQASAEQGENGCCLLALSPVVGPLIPYHLLSPTLSPS